MPKFYYQQLEFSYHTEPVWNDRMVGRVTTRLVSLHVACYGVGEPMAEVHLIKQCKNEVLNKVLMKGLIKRFQ